MTKPKILWFGEPWTAPVCQPKDALMGTPSWMHCEPCKKGFQEGDQGVLIQNEAKGWTGYHKDCIIEEIMYGRVSEGELIGQR